MPSQVFLHSARSDFADTEVLPARKGPGASQGPCWFGCGCGAERLVRVPRAGWMRVLPLMRLYVCLECRRRVLRPRMRARSGYGSVYLPARPLHARNHHMLHLLARLPPVAPRAR
jgi:hypothetical protein